MQQYRWRTTVDQIDTAYGEKLSHAGDKINTFFYNISSDYYQFINTFQDAQSSQIINMPFDRADSTVVEYLTADFHPQWELMQNLMLDKYEQVPVDIRVKLIRWYFEPYLMQQKTAIYDTARVVYLDSSSGTFKFANNRALYNNYVDTTGVIGNIYPLSANTPLSGSFDIIINGVFYDFGHTDMKPGEIYYLTDDMDGWLIPYSEGGKGNNLSLPFAVALHRNAGFMLTDRAITKDLPCYPICPPRELQFQKEIVPTPTPTPTFSEITCTDPQQMTCDDVSFHLHQIEKEDIANKSTGLKVTNTNVVPTSGNKLHDQWSLLFNGSASMTIPYSSGFPYAFGSNDFTIEFQIFPTAQPSNASIIQNSINVQDNSNSWGWVVLYTGGRIMFGYSPTGKAGTGMNNSWKFPLTDTTVPDMDTWSHVAFVRDGDAIRSYLNGQLISQGTFDGDPIFDPSAPLTVGRRDSADHFTGQLQDVRISNRAVYSGSCVDMPNSLHPVVMHPANIPDINDINLLYQPENTAQLWQPHGIDLIGNSTVTPSVSHVATPDIMGIGSVEISGGSVDMQHPLSSFEFLQSSANPYTVECYVQFNRITMESQAIYSEVNTTANNGTGLYLTPIGNDVKLVYTVYNGSGGASSVLVNSETVPVENKWYHVAIANDGNGAIDMYINGKLETSKTWNVTNTAPSTFNLRVGKEPNSNNYPLSGNIQSLRIVDTLVYPRAECIDYMKQPQPK